MHVYNTKLSIFQSNVLSLQNWIWGTWKMSIFFKPSEWSWTW